MGRALGLCAVVVAGFSAGTAGAKVRAGDTAPLFRSVDENHQPVDMKELIRGKPLVLAVGSAS